MKYCMRSATPEMNSPGSMRKSLRRSSDDASTCARVIENPDRRRRSARRKKIGANGIEENPAGEGGASGHADEPSCQGPHRRGQLPFGENDDGRTDAGRAVRKFVDGVPRSHRNRERDRSSSRALIARYSHSALAVEVCKAERGSRPIQARARPAPMRPPTTRPLLLDVLESERTALAKSLKCRSRTNSWDHCTSQSSQNMSVHGVKRSCRVRA